LKGYPDFSKKPSWIIGVEKLGSGYHQLYPIDSHIGVYDYLDIDGSIDVTQHLNIRLGVNNVTERRPPVIGFNANPLLVNGNMAAGMYDTLGRYLFVGFTAKY
jgi:outer membrane receptor protein involved in Fe transport